MRSLESKQYELIKAIRDFKRTNKYATDYLDLFIILDRILKEGDGLSWDRVKQCLITAEIHQIPIPTQFLTDKEVIRLRQLLKTTP